MSPKELLLKESAETKHWQNKHLCRLLGKNMALEDGLQGSNLVWVSGKADWERENRC
jgi:hypothetical protein